MFKSMSADGSLCVRNVSVSICHCKTHRLEIERRGLFRAVAFHYGACGPAPVWRGEIWQLQREAQENHFFVVRVILGVATRTVCHVIFESLSVLVKARWCFCSCQSNEKKYDGGVVLLDLQIVQASKQH